jgi:hypothetical protein
VANVGEMMKALCPSRQSQNNCSPATTRPLSNSTKSTGRPIGNQAPGNIISEAGNTLSRLLGGVVRGNTLSVASGNVTLRLSLPGLLLSIGIRPVIRAAALAAALLPTLALAAERLPPSDYPEMVDVQHALASPAKLGAKVSIFGYPVCVEVGSCRLLASPKRLYPNIQFDASSLKAADRERLMHCLDPGTTEPCTAVLYSVRDGGTMKPDRIWWRGAE